MTKTETARQYRLQYGKEMPTRKLARIMYGENNLLFKDFEDARKILGNIEGKRGSTRKQLPEEFVIKDTRPMNPYKLPESDETEYKPYVLKGYKKIGLFYDVHCPYHSVSSLNIAIEYCKKSKVDLLVLGGDFWDFHGLSRFLKDPKKRKFGDEIKVGILLLEALQKALGCKIIYLLGNHCERLQHFIWQKWGELEQLGDLEELHEITLENIVRRRSPKLNIEFVGEKRIIRAGELNIVHGHEFGASVFSPVNVARGLYLRAKGNTICGHHHRTSEHTEKNIEEKIITTWSVGKLCEDHPAYLPINNWNSGFAIVELDDKGKTFLVHNKRIYKNQVF